MVSLVKYGTWFYRFLKLPSLLPLSFSDTRETAFVYSISAAGVVFAVTEACSRGSLLQCTCDNTIRDISSDGEWVWGGCHDDVDFGYVKSREFMDARRKKRLGDVTTKIQLHNNEAGRLVSNFF